jgi:anti-sigma-K factor RskA
MSSHEFSGLTGAYALDALDEQERAQFEAHLSTCADCAAEVRSLRAAAAELSHTTPAAPPPELRAGILDAIGKVRPLPPAGDNVVELATHRSSRWLWQAVAAACLLLAVAAAGWGYQQHRDANHRQDRSTAIISVLESPDVRTVVGEVGSTGRATLVYSKAEHRYVLLGRDVPAPSGNRTYQLWMIDPRGGATSAGLFRPDANGNVLVQAGGDLSGAASMGISLEPDGGSSRPTPGAILAVMTI